MWHKRNIFDADVANITDKHFLQLYVNCVYCVCNNEHFILNFLVLIWNAIYIFINVIINLNNKITCMKSLYISQKSKKQLICFILFLYLFVINL